MGETDLFRGNTRWGDVDTVTTKLTKRRLEWLGHLARMQDQRIPKITLFSWLPQSRPPGGPRRRWRDLVKKDIKAAGIAENTWYKDALHREKWHQAYNESITEHQLSQRQQKQNGPREIQCNECGRCFRREGDKARHKCLAERMKPIEDQQGSVKCQTCHKWFRSKGGLTVHKCGKSD